MLGTIQHSKYDDVLPNSYLLMCDLVNSGDFITAHSRRVETFVKSYSDQGTYKIDRFRCVRVCTKYTYLQPSPDIPEYLTVSTVVPSEIPDVYVPAANTTKRICETHFFLTPKKSRGSSIHHTAASTYLVVERSILPQQNKITAIYFYRPPNPTATATATSVTSFVADIELFLATYLIQS